MVIRLLAGLIAAVALWSAISAGTRTGSYWGVLIVLAAAGAFLFLEARPRRGTALYAFQYLFVRLLLALAVIGLGIFAIYLGLSELVEPLQFGRIRLDLASRVIRQLVGSPGLSILFCAIGAWLIFKGFRMLPGSSLRSSHKSSN
ncbi:hypothetical protein EZJ19_13340 [Parasulfuritortus cantonensis]|uniref:Uncharacterized protein n=1 Tax=Parasulfuritortus cantonensis TaxID=2528202 RepID=A0A4R1B1Q2_9PROT|nr:hypothetical protein [Parasulfuritortus cantonensis]TCJ11944.1 hypothetical protein EZJ19_13340 [Parasulfuritortus cantonensis]